MKIAFDVKGTIEGPKKAQVLKMFKAFQDAGHEVFVWSNSYGYAIDAVRDNKLNAEAMDKKMMLDYDDKSEAMDIAVEDDRSQTWLGAKKFIFVDEIPELDSIDEFIKEYLK